MLAVGDMSPLLQGVDSREPSMQPVTSLTELLRLTLYHELLDVNVCT
jgi:hypothetical protein